MGILNQIHHVAILASDYETSKEFYVDKLGFEVLRENFRPERGDVKLDLRCGDCELELFAMAGCSPRIADPEAYGLRHLAFAVESVEETAMALNALGIETEPVRSDPYTNKKITFFRDPDGLPLELHE